jgi:transcriptional regulator
MMMMMMVLERLTTQARVADQRHTTSADVAAVEHPSANNIRTDAIATAAASSR